MPKITKKQALALAKQFDINLETVGIQEWQYGLNVELEHGSKLGPLTNVTKDDLQMTAKIVIAHLMEDVDYYKYLKIMETELEKTLSRGDLFKSEPKQRNKIGSIRVNSFKTHK